MNHNKTQLEQGCSLSLFLLVKFCLFAVLFYFTFSADKTSGRIEFQKHKLEETFD